MDCKKCGLEKQQLNLEMIDLNIILGKDEKRVIEISVHCQDINCGELLSVGYMHQDQLIKLDNDNDDDCNHPAAAVCQYNNNGKCLNEKGCNFKY